MKRIKWMICVAVFLAATGLYVCHAAEESSGRQPAATLTIKPDWPSDVKDWRHVRVFLIIGDRQVRSARPTDNGEIVFGELQPGNYTFKSTESSAAMCGIEIAGKVSIAADTRHITVKAAVNHVKLVTVKVKASLDGAAVTGDLKFWRSKGNVGRSEILPAGVDLKLIAGRKYFFELEPYSSKARKVLVGPVDPVSLVKTGLNIKVKMKTLTIVYRWKIRDVDQKLLRKHAKLQPFLFRIKADGTRQPIEDRQIVREHAADPGKERPKLKNVYDLPDGIYELRARIAGRSYYTDVLVPKAPVRFKVTDGKAVPAEIDLVFSSEKTGTFSITVLDRNGKHLPKARVSLTRDPVGRFWSSKTDDNGTVVTPRLGCGSYKIVVGVDGMPFLQKQVVLKAGVNPVTVGFTSVVDLRLRILDSHSRPAQTEGRIYKRLDLSDDIPIGSSRKDGKSNRKLFLEDFPVLIYALVLNKNRQDLPEMASTMVEAPPKGRLVLKAYSAAVRDIHVQFPTKWIGKERGYACLWITRQGTVLPVAIFGLRPSSRTKLLKRTKDETTLEGKIRLAPGKYELLLRIGWGKSISWLGSIDMPKDGALRLILSEKDVKARKTLSELRPLIKAGNAAN